EYTSVHKVRKSSIWQSADWVIDLGPGGGDSSGHIVAQGQPEEIAKSPTSITGKYLKTLL
ncbi:MAG TPA: hypothetical protein PKK23_21415, partial [Nitrospirales bacterium]|nr:hypothetical protein [Nitrospirales bacterium]